MNLLNKFFSKKSDPVTTNDEFWKWFTDNNLKLHKALKSGNPEKNFVNVVAPKLNELHPGYFCLAGMLDNITAELIITADGNIKNIVFVEELVAAAPKLNNWKFTALKPQISLDDFGINLGGIKFNSDNLHFVSHTDDDYPDEIYISIIHDDYTYGEHDKFSMGINIFLDNYLGELNYAENIDALDITQKSDTRSELIPISKLKHFLDWRKKEFIEKYLMTTYDSSNDSFASVQSKSESGEIFGIYDTDLLLWNEKASHPWIIKVEIHYQGNQDGLPDNLYLEKLNDIEEILVKSMDWKMGQLYIGHSTGNGLRIIYFACREYRDCSKTVNNFIKNNSNFNINYEIYKDKYWRTFDNIKDALSNSIIP